MIFLKGEIKEKIRKEKRKNIPIKKEVFREV